MLGCIGLLALLLLGPAEAPPQHGEAWWRTPQVQQALALTPQQIQRLEQIFHENLEERVAQRKKLAKLDAEFAKLLKAGEIGRIEESQLVERMEDLRARVNVRRATMLMAMYRTLSAEQRKTLKAMFPPGGLGKKK